MLFEQYTSELSIHFINRYTLTVIWAIPPDDDEKLDFLDLISW